METKPKTGHVALLRWDPVERERAWLIGGCLVGFVLCVPMILGDRIPSHDAAGRYLPMIADFVAGNWRAAFHPRIQPLLTALAGCLATIGLPTFIAAKVVSSVFFAVTVFPLYAAVRRVFSRHYAFGAVALYLVCPRLLRIAGMGIRDSGRTFFLILGVWALLVFWQERRWSAALAAGVAAAGMTLARVEGAAAAAALMICLVAVSMRPHKQITKALALGRVVVGMVLGAVLIFPWLVYCTKATGYAVTGSQQIAVLRRIEAMTGLSLHSADAFMPESDPARPANLCACAGQRRRQEVIGHWSLVNGQEGESEVIGGGSEGESEVSGGGWEEREAGGFAARPAVDMSRDAHDTRGETPGEGVVSSRYSAFSPAVDMSRDAHDTRGETRGEGVVSNRYSAFSPAAARSRDAHDTRGETETRGQDTGGYGGTSGIEYNLKSQISNLKSSPLFLAAGVGAPEVEELQRPNIDWEEVGLELIEGLIPLSLVFALPLIFLRIRDRKWTFWETVVAAAVGFHVFMLVVMVLGTGGTMISKRYVISVTPLTFGWTAMGVAAALRWVRKRNVKVMWILVVLFILICLRDGWSRVRRNYTSRKDSNRKFIAAGKWVGEQAAREGLDRKDRMPSTWFCYRTGRRPFIMTSESALTWFADGETIDPRSVGETFTVPEIAGFCRAFDVDYVIWDETFAARCPGLREPHNLPPGFVLLNDAWLGGDYPLAVLRCEPVEVQGERR